MATLKRNALRFIGNSLFKYIYKNPERNMLKLVNVAEKVVGGQYPATTWSGARNIITKDNNIWHSFLYNGLNEVDHDMLRKLALTFGIDLGYFGTKTLRANREIYKCNIPWVILMDPTSACNLKCKGCWAAEYGYKSNLSIDLMRKAIKESKALGTHFFMFTGGEPLIKKDEIITLASENQDCLFLAYTNGTLVDEKLCEDIKKCGNISLALSIEGNEETNDARRGNGVYEKTINAMKLLKKHKCIFGTSVCYTSQNYKAVTSNEFFDLMIDNGAKFAWFFHYMPVGNGADTNLLLSPKQREHVYRELRNKRNSKTGKPIFTVDFQNDGEFVGGCIAGGRNYFHINSEGDMEPCVFIHYSDSNIKDKSVLEALKSPLFYEYYKGQPFNDNHLRPCPMLENPDALRHIVNTSKAKSTNLLKEESVEELCSKCDEYAANWAGAAKEIWEEKERMQTRTRYYRDINKENK